MSNLRRVDSDRSDSSVESQSSDGAFSTCTRNTDPADYHELRPVATRGETWPSAVEQHHKKVSINDGPLYADHIEIAEFEDDDLDDQNDLDAPDDAPEFFGTDAVPSSDESFITLFPSPRQRLDIRHDDSTSDGNMNIRVDTVVNAAGGRDQKVILFHLRMYDLKTRAFSLRRYCRDSQREVCTTIRKTKAQQQLSRPALARSLSNLIPKGFSTSKSDVKSKSAGGLNRQNSGGLNGRGGDDDDLDQDMNEAKKGSAVSIADLSDTVTLQFMDYAQVDVTRRGFGSHVHYDFEYWGKKYTWKRVYRSDFELGFTTYHLVRRNDDKPLAHITPKQDGEAQRDKEAGGWVPPSNFWLLDKDLTIGLADKIVSSGLIALVDDTIRTVYHSKETRPSSALSIFNPRRILSETFPREGRPQTAH